MTYNDQPIEYLAEYPNALPPGTKLKNGAYRVMNVLGQGSFGITYLAVTPEDQLFAVKEYFHKAYCERSADNSMSYSSNAEGAQEVIDGFRNFTNEAANLTRIYSENQRRAETARSQERHNLLAEENYNIVRVVESFEENKTSYLVMEYLDGGNLLQRLSKPMSEDMAVSIIIPIAWAVQHLHDNHIMHKDIKPENIMMRSGNLVEPKLIDFGTTLHYDRSGKLTSRSIGDALGTDNYCSLEHSATNRLTPHLDVYSLGATLFHMVTGSPRDPWGDRPQPIMVMEHIKNGLAKVNVSERVRMAILQAMDNDPNSRTQTAREFIENLNSPFLPLGSILESPNGNRYRIISVEGQEQNYLSYKAERLLKDVPIINSGTTPIDKVNDGSVYSVHESFARELCRRDENQCVISNRGHWPKQDYLAHVKEYVGLVKIPSISVDKQNNPLAEMFTANGTIYCIKNIKNFNKQIFESFKDLSVWDRFKKAIGEQNILTTCFIVLLAIICFGLSLIGTTTLFTENTHNLIEYGIVSYICFLFVLLLFSILSGKKWGFHILIVLFFMMLLYDAIEGVITNESSSSRVIIKYIVIIASFCGLLFISLNLKKKGTSFWKKMDNVLSDRFSKNMLKTALIGCFVYASFCLISFAIESKREKHDEIITTELLDNLVRVKGGTFYMGATKEQGTGYDSDETPVHQVKISDFMISKYEVSQKLWYEIMGYNNSPQKGENLPVTNVSWDKCQEFIRELNKRTGKQFRLPTEAEWEYAARGGSLSKGYRYSGGNIIDDVSWNVNNSSDSIKAVGLKNPNELGIYDMSGNVWEWCYDYYSDYSNKDSIYVNPHGAKTGEHRVNRGGSINSGTECRVSYRSMCIPSDYYRDVGFRIAL